MVLGETLQPSAAQEIRPAVAQVHQRGPPVSHQAGQKRRARVLETADSPALRPEGAIEILHDPGERSVWRGPRSDGRSREPGARRHALGKRLDGQTCRRLAPSHAAHAIADGEEAEVGTDQVGVLVPLPYSAAVGQPECPQCSNSRRR